MKFIQILVPFTTLWSVFVATPLSSHEWTSPASHIVVAQATGSEGCYFEENCQGRQGNPSDLPSGDIFVPGLHLFGDLNLGISREEALRVMSERAAAQAETKYDLKEYDLSDMYNPMWDQVKLRWIGYPYSIGRSVIFDNNRVIAIHFDMHSSGDELDFSFQRLFEWWSKYIQANWLSEWKSWDGESIRYGVLCEDSRRSIIENTHIDKGYIVYVSYSRCPGDEYVGADGAGVQTSTSLNILFVERHQF